MKQLEIFVERIILASRWLLVIFYIGLGIGERTAHEMDHLPISGPDGSLERLRALASPHRVYTHINNTNPMLLVDSPERARVEEAGFQIGADGMRFTL